MIQEDQIKELFDSVDIGKSGHISSQQFVGLIKRKFPSFSEKVLLQIFKIIDFNDSNEMERNEFSQFFYALSKAPFKNDAEVIFACSDMNRNNALERDEADRILSALEYNVMDPNVMKIVNRYYVGSQISCDMFRKLLDDLYSALGK